MRSNKILAVVAALAMALPMVEAQTTTPAPAPGAHALGSVKSVGGNSIALMTDKGTEITVEVQPGTRILQLAAGQRDLKAATPIQLNDVQPGDRALVRGTASADGRSILANSVIVMKQSDIDRRQQQEREDWQRRGVGGLVTAVDPAAGTVTITPAPHKTVTVQTTKATVIRRYSPDSVKFDDAKPATLEQVKVGDQLRAKGNRSEDGSQMRAEEIVEGTFRNIAGVVISTDPATNSVTLKDLATKKPVTVKVSGESEMRQMPVMLARRLAMQLKGVNPEAQKTSAGEAGSTPRPNSWSGEHNSPGAEGAGPHAGPPDLQQILRRMPAVNLGELKKGEPVMVVATEGSASSEPTVITLLTGVEPILSASPNDNRATMLLSPWSLGGGAPGEGAQ